MPRLDSISIEGQTGRVYSFRVYVLDNRFRALPGVYVVAERTKEPGESPRYVPVYVGETADLSTLSGGHEKRECFDMCLANTIGVLPEKDAQQRTRIAFDLIARHRPICNVRE